ncbi:MAG: hypothetical protein QME77_12790 [bacterium]|nr:hypothetical protein [bacterium]
MTEQMRKAILNTELMFGACNLGGLARSFGAEIIPALQEEAHRLGRGTDWVNHHPIVVLWVEKMAELCGLTSVVDHDAWSAAYRAFKAMLEAAREAETMSIAKEA